MADLLASQADLVAKYQGILDRAGESVNVQSVSVTQPLKGENFASICLYVALHLTDGKARELFIKQMPTNELQRGMLTELKIFDKEADFYNKLLPVMQAYWTWGSGGQGQPMGFFLKCLHADGTELLFENIVKGQGYYLVPKKERQNMEQVKLALKNLAQFHATGYCMVQDAGGRDAFMEQNPLLAETLFTETYPMISHMLEGGLGLACDLLANSKIPGSDHALEKMSALRGQAVSQVCKLVSPESPHAFHVVNHGDCWNNNMLFKNDPTTGAPAHNVLVDFQFGRVGSPALDLTYYMCTSIPTKVRRQNWTQLLQFYFEAFRDVVEHLGHGGAKFPFTFDQFVVDYHTKFPLGFFMNINMTIGADIAAEFDVANLPGIPEGTDMMALAKDMFLTWITKNPAKAEGYTRELIEMWSEYEQIVRP